MSGRGIPGSTAARSPIWSGRWSAAEAVEVVDAGGHFLGRGFYNPRPSLACRLLTRADEPVDPPLFLRRLTAALDYRAAAGTSASAYRLCWSEADGLPGLVVDRYGPASVAQCLTLGMARSFSAISAALDALSPASRCTGSTTPRRPASRGSPPSGAGKASPAPTS